jgi:hypothetical protein
MQHLLSNLDTGGLLGPQIQPLLARLTGLLGTADNPVEEVQRRIRIQTVGARAISISTTSRPSARPCCGESAWSSATTHAAPTQ